MSLDARIARLEAATRQRRAQPCRWHSWAVIFPDSFPPGTTRQQARGMCDAPGQCPGEAGLFVDIGGDDEGDEERA